MRRTNVNGHYFYEAGIGPRVLALNRAFPDHYQNLASYAFDHKCSEPTDGMLPFGGLVSG
jgi:hypothetical protein